MIGSHHVQGDASSQPDDLQEGAKEDRGKGQGGQGEGEGESPLGEVEFHWYIWTELAHKLIRTQSWHAFTKKGSTEAPGPI